MLWRTFAKPSQVNFFHQNCWYLCSKSQGIGHLDLSRCPFLHKSLQPVLRTVRVVIQPESSGWASGSIACIIIHFNIADAKIPNGWFFSCWSTPYIYIYETDRRKGMPDRPSLLVFKNGIQILFSTSTPWNLKNRCVYLQRNNLLFLPYIGGVCQSNICENVTDAEGLEQASQWHEIFCHDLEVISLD